MLRRKFYQKLLEWKKGKRNECLLIKGARQVGKTFIVEQFGKTEYKSFIEINFYSSPSLKTIFDGDLTSQEIIKKITAYIPNIKIVPNNTLIFLDEIQLCSKARTALKFLALDNSIDVIATGSLLGLSYGEDVDKEVTKVDSIPVGYERQVTLYPLDFEEFLWGIGYKEESISYLKDYYLNLKKVPDELNEKYLSLVREFIVVGGMPEVVNDYSIYKDFTRVEELQKKILDSYNDDISNHTRLVEKIKVRECYNSIPRQLARENKKFKFSDVDKNGSFRKYFDSISWLSDASLIYLCNNLSLIQVPLNYSDKENEFKVYLSDTGLLLSLYGFLTKKQILSDELKGFAKGGIYENFVALELVKKGYSLHYFKNNNRSEIEFVIEYKDGIVPIEVKSSNNQTKSLNEYISSFKPQLAFKFIKGNVGKDNEKVSLPHYMIMFI